MGQAGGLDDHTEIAGVAPFRQLVAEHLADPHAQRAADAADFEGMGQACVDVVIAGDRVHLRLAPQPAEGAGEYDAVMVLVERAAAEFGVAVHRFAEAFAGEQGMPVHSIIHPFATVTTLAARQPNLNAHKPSASISISSRRRPWSMNIPAVMQCWLLVASR
ncbi:hypothetical protein D9M71_172150 [compost metagenome]